MSSGGAAFGVPAKPLQLARNETISTIDLAAARVSTVKLWIEFARNDSLLRFYFVPFN
jgi:hypothetical protein